MKYNIFKLPPAFKFSEEIISKCNDPISPIDKQEDFNIIFKESQKCKDTPDNPFISESTICRNCYYEEFANKMLTVRKSKRKNFVEFQMNLRIDKLKFLDELNELLIDCESFFNHRDYDTKLDYQYAIEELRNSNSLAGKLNQDYFTNLDIFSKQIFELPTTSKKYSLDIFISHSSIDKSIALKLIKVLRAALNIQSDKILCTSVNGYKLEGGVNTDEHLRVAIEENKVFIGIISENSLKSNYVLFELGARWGLKLPFKPVVTRKEDLAHIKAPLNNMHIQNLSEKSDVIQLVTEISKILYIDLENPNVYLDSIEDLIIEINR